MSDPVFDRLHSSLSRGDRASNSRSNSAGRGGGPADGLTPSPESAPAPEVEGRPEKGMDQKPLPLAVPRPGVHFGKGDGMQSDFLFPGRLPGEPDAPGQVEAHGFRRQAGRARTAAEPLEALGLVTRLLAELARGGLRRVLLGA